MTRWLTPEEDRTWRRWLEATELLNARIGRDLQADCGLSEPDFKILVVLSEVRGGRLRMTELVGALRWSKSRLSHQLTRMEARGLVVREGCPNDARGTFAHLTPAGRREIRRAAPRHLESVRRNFIDLLGPSELEALGDACDVVASHLRATGPAPECDRT